MVSFLIRVEDFNAAKARPSGALGANYESRESARIGLFAPMGTLALIRR